MRRARVHRSAKRVFDCKLLQENQLVEATALATLLKEKHIVVGDYVKLAYEEGEFRIEEVEPRQNEIFRMNIREQKKKVIAANCEVMVILVSGEKPEYKRGLVDRYLLRSIQWEIPAVVVFNKMDVFSGEFDLGLEEERLKSLSVPCFEVSALTPSYRPQYLSRGWDDLKKVLQGKTSIFMGQSGVGKSHLISTLTEGHIKLDSRAIGQAGKGVHTTTWCEIVEWKDYTLIDSPGVRSFSLEDILTEDLLSYFPDLEIQAQNCQFHDCSHDEKAKGCSFFAPGFNENSLGFLLLTRLESFHKFKEETSKTPDWKKQSKRS